MKKAEANEQRKKRTWRARLRGLAFVERDKRRLRRNHALDAALAFADAALSHDFAHRFLALAATRRHTEFELKLVERIGAFRDGRADLTVGDGLAHANDHG